MTVEDKLNAARLLPKLGESKRAIILLNSALKSSPGNVDVLIQKGKVYNQLKLTKAANKCFQDALERCGEDIENEMRTLNFKIATKLYLYTVLDKKEEGRKYISTIKDDFPNNKALIDKMEYIISIPVPVAK